MIKTSQRRTIRIEVRKRGPFEQRILQDDDCASAGSSSEIGSVYGQTTVVDVESSGLSPQGFGAFLVLRLGSK